MTQGNQTYSVLTRQIISRRADGWLLTMGLGLGVTLTPASCDSYLVRVESDNAIQANALTYEDGLALANKRLRKPLPKSAREEVEAMVEIAWRESRFNPKMQNPKSSSHQLFGFLKSTCKNYGGCGDTMSHVRAALAYCYDRYGSPKRALDFHKRNRYY